MAVTTRPMDTARSGKRAKRSCHVCGRPTPSDNLAKDPHTSRYLDPPICLKCRQARREAEKVERDAQIDAQYPPRTCNECGRTKPASQMEMSKGRPMPTCKRCGNRRKRLSEAGIDLGHAAVRSAPDPAPAVDLREMLAWYRSQGVTFEEAWSEAVGYALDGIRRSENRRQWSTAFEATSSAWQAGYERQLVAGGLTVSLLDAAA